MGWKEVTIGELGRVVTGNTPPTNDPRNYGGEYPFIKPTDMVVDQRYVSDWEENYSEKSYERYKNSYIPPLSTGVVTIGTVGEKIFQSNRYCFTNQSVNVVIPFEEYDKDFVYYLLKVNLPKVLNANPGTASGRHHVSKSNFCAIKVKVPESIEIQHKIASILSAYDDLIENNLKRMKLLEEKVQLTYKEWFVRMKFPGYESKRYNYRTVLPEDWEIQKLGDLVTLAKETVQPRELNPKTPYIGLEHMPRKSISLLTWENSSKVDSTKYRIRQNDILFGKIRPYFHKVGVSFTDGITSTDVIVIRPKSALLHGIVLQTVYSDKFVNTATQSSNGTKMPRANWKFLRNYPVVIPNEYLQSLFQKISEDIINEIGGLIKQNILLKEARDILLPRLMTGMIDVAKYNI